MATRRSWTTAGQTKGAANSIATATANTVGTDYPQVGDLVYVAVACDNTGTGSPTHLGSGPTITGGGAVGSWTVKQRPGSMSATAAASAQLIVCYGRVTTAFTASTVLTLSLSSSPNAKTICAFAFAGSALPTTETGPVQAASASMAAAVAGEFNLAIVGTTSTATGVGGSGTNIVSISTTGGSSATNVQVVAKCDAGPGVTTSASGGTVDAGYSALIPNQAAVFPWADAYYWDGSSMIIGDLYQWDGATLQPLDVFGVV